MNIRILAASALALAILVPAANAATSHQGDRKPSGSGDTCTIGSTMNLLTDQCVPLRAKVIHARVVKHVVKPANTAFARMAAIQNSHNEM